MIQDLIDWGEWPSECAIEAFAVVPGHPGDNWISVQQMNALFDRGDARTVEFQDYVVSSGAVFFVLHDDGDRKRWYPVCLGAQGPEEEVR